MHRKPYSAPKSLVSSGSQVTVADLDSVAVKNTFAQPAGAKRTTSKPDSDGALKMESETANAAVPPPTPVEGVPTDAHGVPPSADEVGTPCSATVLSLACICRGELPSGCEGQADPESPSCVMGYPSRPLARKPHAAYLKEAKAQPVGSREAAARLARQAAQSGKSYHELLAEGTQYASKQDWRRAARACREAIALAPDEPVAYAALGGVFLNSKLYTEAAQWYLEAKERSPEGSSEWAVATANAFDLLRQTACDEAAKPEWWTDEELKVLSAKVVRAAPADVAANRMRACVLSGRCAAWVAGPRSSAEFKEAGAHFEQAAAGVRLQGLLQRCRPSPRKTRYRPRYPKACSPAHQMSSVPPSQASATASDRWGTSDSPSNSE